MGAGLQVNVCPTTFSASRKRRKKTNKGPKRMNLVKKELSFPDKTGRIKVRFFFALPFMISIIAGFEIRDKTVHIKTSETPY